jgi:hypothetical protein
MRYQNSVYTDFSSFLGKATEIAKDKIGLYNALIDPPARKRLEGNAFQKLLEFIIFLLKRAGWFVYIAIAALLGLGMLGFFGGIGGLMATNPFLAAAVLALGGSGIYLVWKNRDVYTAHAAIGKQYKKDFDDLQTTYPELESRTPYIHSLMNQCVRSICVEVFSINSDNFMNKLDEEEN